MTWLMKNLKSYVEEQFPIKYCAVKHLILLNIQKLGKYQTELATVVYKFFDKKDSGGASNS